jgi:putative addiction module antidote
MLTLKLTKVGNSTGIVLPKEALVKLRVGQGDTVFLTETADGLRITPYDPDFERQITLARRVARKRRNVLRELSKRLFEKGLCAALGRDSPLSCGRPRRVAAWPRSGRSSNAIRAI